MAVRPYSIWDLAVDDRNGQLVLVVEVKRKTNASPEWAAKLRHSRLSGGIQKVPYLLIAFPDRFYLWANAGADQAQSEPTYTIDAQPILQPYFERSEVTVDQITVQSLELIMAAWLREIIYSGNLPENALSTQHWLIESGLYAALTGGKLEYEKRLPE